MVDYISGCFPILFSYLYYSLEKCYCTQVILVINQSIAQILVLQKVYYIPLHVSSTVVLITRR